MTELVDLWPDAYALQEVMKTDAESAGEAVVLAVHQPMRFRKRPVGQAADVGEWVDEKELLKHFLADSPDGRVIVPIVGAPGSGKSHVVRWLNVHLRHQRDAAKRRIIRIPKGRSLKGVLEDLLGEVEGPQYERFRHELKQAQERIEPERAAHALCEALAQEVEVLAKRAAELEREGKGTETTKSQRAFGLRSLLPTLLRDQRLRDLHFVDRLDRKPGVVRRLVAQLYEERVDAPVDDRAHVFVPEDLHFADDIKRDELGQDVVRAMETVERGVNPLRAASVLNAALDISKQQLLGLSPTVTDLFLKIREQLFSDGMELILLVEDFVVLSGLQGQLLQVMIQEAWRDGRQIRCTMRAAIAYTPGYLQTDTVLTRAGYEYRIPDEDESETITTRRIRKLVGAYLNAARVGQVGLVNALEAAPSGIEDRSWVPLAPEPENDDVRRTVEAFGREDGVPLHPFTPEAITAFAEEACRKDHRLLYNPRFVINHILLHVLRHRSEFEKGMFPEGRFRPASSPVHLESALHDWVLGHVARADQSRYITFLSYWAFGKQSIAQLVTVLRVLGPAFGLPVPSGVPLAGDVPDPVPPTPPGRREDEAEPRPPTPNPVPTASRWATRLDAWRKGQELSQSESRTLRKEVLGPAVFDNIDWDWLACRRREIDRNWWEQIWIQGAASNPVSEAASAVVMASADERSDPRIAAEFAAVADAQERGGDWNVEGREADLARACAFVERHTPPLRAYLFERPFGTSASWSPLRRTVQGLAIGARLLQAPGGRAKNHTELVGGLFASIPETRANGGEETDTWPAARRALATIRLTSEGRPSWGEILLEQAAARQGGANMVHAVDAARLKPLLDDVMARWQLDLQDPPLSPTQRRSAAAQSLTGAAVIDPLRRLDTAMAHEVASVQQWLALMQLHFPAELDLPAFSKGFAIALDALVKSPTGGLSHPEFRKLRALLDNLLEVPFRAALAEAAQIEPDKPRADLLWRLGRVSSEARSASEGFVQYAETVLCRIEMQLSEKVTASGDPQAVAVSALKAELGELEAALGEAQP